MGIRTKMETGCQKDSIHFDADRAGELKTDSRVFLSFQPARENASAADHDRSGEEAHGARRVGVAECGESQTPAVVPAFRRRNSDIDCLHMNLIGSRDDSLEPGEWDKRAKENPLC